MWPHLLPSLLFPLTLLPFALSAVVPAQENNNVARTDAIAATNPPSHLYNRGELNVQASDFGFLTLDNGVFFILQYDSNFVAYQNNVAQWADGVVRPAGCRNNGHTCGLIFQGDGNLVSFYDGQPVWSSATAGKGNTLVFYDAAPFIRIYNAANKVVWSTPLPPPPPPPDCPVNGKPCP